MWIILDLIIAAIFIYFIAAGIKKGFIKSCFGLVVTLLSVFITINCYAPVSGFLRDTVVYDNLKENLKESIEDHIGASNDTATVARLFEDAETELPDFYRILLSLNFDSDKAAKEIDKIIDEGREFTVELLCERLVEEASVFVSNALAIIIVFLGALLALNILIYLLDIIFKLPILNFANRTLGLVIGLVKAFVFAFVIVAAIRLALPYLDGSGIKLSESDMEHTLLFSAIDNINPLSFDK